MLPKESGIINFEDLPHEDIFVSLKSEFFNLMNNKIRVFGITNLSKELKISVKILIHWLSESSLIRLDILIEICKYFNLKFISNIEYIRGKKGGKIINPKFPLDFTSNQGVQVIAGILGDGGIPKNRGNPYYTNTNKDLISAFIKNITSVFGNLEFNSRESVKEASVCTILELPSFCKKIFLKLGLKEGKKVETNQNIPKFILNSGREKTILFISQLLDDEGTVNLKAKFISFTNTCLYNEKSSLLSDLQSVLLNEFEIDSLLYKGDRYKSSRGKDRQQWKLQINSQFNLRRLKEILKLNHLKKDQKLSHIISSSKLFVFPKRRVKSIYIEFMKELETEKGFFTSKDIAKKSGMKIESCRNILTKFKKDQLVKCIDQALSGDMHNYTKYVLR